MRAILNDINQAYQFISTILVSGDAVEAVTASRVKLRNAMAACEVKIREEDERNARKEKKKGAKKAPIKED